MELIEGDAATTSNSSPVCVPDERVKVGCPAKGCNNSQLCALCHSLSSWERTRHSESEG